MTDQVGRRLAANEALMRNVNEGIERGQWPGDDEPVGFRCECARLGCTVLLALTVAEYEHVRTNPQRFVVGPGHEEPRVETVVKEHDGYLVVEKHGDAGEVAEALDPRS